MATLADLARQYLSQSLPDISGIFSLRRPFSPASTSEVVNQTSSPAGLTRDQLELLYPQGSSGRDDDFKGGGLFGNLDLTRSKTVVRDVYDEELGDFVPTELTAYYNPQLGSFQTFEGKNITPAFSNTGASFGFAGGILDALGIKPRTVGGYIPGSIRGIYDTPIDFFNRNRNIQRQTDQQKADIRRVQRDIDSGKYDGSGEDNRDASKATTSAASKSSGVGVGGYTSQDSARDEARGRR